MKQIIIVRKDLNMSSGKFAAQVSHASMAFLSNWLRNNMDLDGHIDSWMDTDIMDWINGSFIKIVCESRNKHQLEKVITISNELGFKENKDFFLIKDNCCTELEPEEFDEDGIGRTLTCIGFRPLPDDIAKKISKKYQLYN